MIAPGRQQGFVLMLVVVVLFLFASIAILLNYQSASGANAASDELQASQAEYVAQAAVRNAKWLASRQSCAGDFALTDVGFGDHTYSATATVQAGGSPATIAATGTLNNGLARTIVQTDVPIYDSAAASTLVLQPGPEGKDTFIEGEGGHQDHNKGDDRDLKTDSESGKEYRTLLQFDLGGIPRSAAILSADLTLHMDSSQGAADTVEVHRVTAYWSESAVTWIDRNSWEDWSTPGGDFDANVAATFETTALGEAAVDISELVEQWVSGEAPNYGMMLLSPSNTGDNEKRFVSGDDDADPTLWPRLEITYACECGTVCVPTQGMSKKVKLIASSYFSPSEDESFKKAMFESWGYSVDLVDDDTSGWLWDLAVADADVLYVSASVTPSKVAPNIVGIDVGVVSEGAGLNEEMGFTTGSASPVGDEIVVDENAHYITSAFPNGALQIFERHMQGASTSGTMAAGAQVLARWSGGAAVAVLDAGATNTAGDPSPARRVLVPMGSQGSINLDYVGHNGWLMIQRAIEWAAGPSVETGATPLLLVVGDPGSLSSRDEDMIALFETWGYVVNVIDDSADQAEFDTNAAANSVVYVAASISSGALSDKLTGSATPIVNEFDRTLDNFGFSSSTSNTITEDTFASSDSAHYISSPFGGAAINALTTSVSMSIPGGTLAPGLEFPASFSFVARGLVTLDTGAERWDGSPSPARRAHVPFGAAPIADLTTDARTLLKRTVEWAAGAGAAAPQLRVLLVVDDPASLTAQEVSKRALLESWGHTVTLIDDGASQSEFDAAVATADVAYVAEDINSGTLGTKLREAAIGVVIEEEKITDEFGISSGETTFTESSVEVVDNTHYITEPFSLGTVTFVVSTQPVGGRAGTPAPDLQVLAVRPSSSTSMLDAIETGGALSDAGTAAGRRVKLPWGGNDFDIDSLTNDGRTILQRSLEWGAGTDLGSSGPIAHWKLDEGTGTTAVDSEGGHDGTLVNGPAWVVGQVGDALEFDGSNDYVDLTSDSELDDVFVGGATVMAWIYPTGWGEAGYGRIFDKSSSASSTGDGWAIRMNVDNSGVINFGQGFSGGRGWWRTPNGSISLNTWQHIAIAYDAGDPANDPVFYLDGSPLSLIRVDTPSGSIRSDANISLRLGNHAGGTSHTFDGTIDDVRIYDRVLSESEIADLFNDASGGPFAHWKLDETSGTTAADSVGGHDGTLTNGPAWVAGQIGGALDFDGSNDLVSVPHQAIFTQVPMTVSAWFKLNTLPTTRSEHGTIVDKRHTVDPYASWTLYVNETLGNKIRFQIRDSSETGYWLDSAASAVTNSWYHVVGTIDESYNAKLYVNGALEPDDDNIGSLFSSNDEIRIGAGWSGGNRLDGLVDDVRFYDRALSAAEISGLYTAGTGGGGGGGGCSGNFRDEFNAVSYSGSDGTESWTGPWTEINENGNVTGGDSRVDDNDSEYHLQVRDNDGGGEGVEREADLSAYTTAVLKFDYRRDGFDNSDDYVTVFVSKNGGSSWEDFEKISGPGTDSSYVSWEHDISEQIGTNTVIRFLTSEKLGSSDELYIDNVEITVSGCAP